MRPDAQDAGYAAALIFNEGQPERDDVVLGTLGADAVDTITIPVVGLSYALGARLVEAPTTEISMDVQTTSETRTTSNVTADLPGRTSRVVHLGAHLGSVAEGPGINDNGSGSAVILETAEVLAGSRFANRLRFSWWGGEEYGLLGSTYYVEQLSEEDLAATKTYLNFDMVSGRSESQAFINNGVPSGGLFTGAEVVKKRLEVKYFGGVAGLAYDPCYHIACDDLVEPNDIEALEKAEGYQRLAAAAAPKARGIAPQEVAPATGYNIYDAR